MKNLLKKLDERAGQLLDVMDDQLHEPIIQVITGKVFVTDDNQADHPDTTPACQEPSEKAHPVSNKLPAVLPLKPQHEC